MSNSQFSVLVITKLPFPPASGLVSAPQPPYRVVLVLTLTLLPVMSGQKGGGSNGGQIGGGQSNIGGGGAGILQSSIN